MQLLEDEKFGSRRRKPNLSTSQLKLPGSRTPWTLLDSSRFALKSLSLRWRTYTLLWCLKFSLLPLLRPSQLSHSPFSQRLNCMHHMLISQSLLPFLKRGSKYLWKISLDMHTNTNCLWKKRFSWITPSHKMSRCRTEISDNPKLPDIIFSSQYQVVAVFQWL